LKINIDEGIQFNLCASNISVCKKNADTLPINKLKNYKLSSLEEVEILETK
jgi:hypothetical protein